jgi:predicted PurR-regulated permease PerM
MSDLDRGLGQKLENNISERLISWGVLLLIFITLWYMLDIVLLTFLLTFIFYHLLGIVKRPFRKLTSFVIPDGLYLGVLYLLVVGLLIVLSFELLPKLVSQFVEIGNAVINFKITDLKEILSKRLYAGVEKLDITSYLTQVGTFFVQGITSVSLFGFNLFLSLILSFLILAENKKIQAFGLNLSKSRMSFLYSYFLNFGGSFVKTFGTVMRVQVTIAFINSIISMVGLALMGFPQILGLGTMIFFLGLIPVAGVIISLFPLCIIAFNLGGLVKVIGILLMIVIIHTLETYILNPKLMSDKTKLPVCFVFMILLVAEHYLGVWGLLIGVPIFIFLLKVFEVKGFSSE